MGNIFVNGQPVCDDYADEDNNAAVVVCRFGEFSSLKIYSSLVNIKIVRLVLNSIRGNFFYIILKKGLGCLNFNSVCKGPSWYSDDLNKRVVRLLILGEKSTNLRLLGTTLQ